MLAAKNWIQKMLCLHRIRVLKYLGLDYFIVVDE